MPRSRDHEASHSRVHSLKTDRVRVRWNLHTVSLAGIVLSMGYAGAVQNNGAAYLLCFVTAVLGAMSWLRARANLRGIEIRAGLMPTTRAGQRVNLPVEVRAASGHAPWGLEILAAGARKSSFLEHLASGATARVPVDLPEQTAGLQTQVRVLVRSSYPLGLFSAERVVDLTCARKVHPRPAGSLPLPAADPALRTDSLALGQAGGHAAREGDDFAGLREWQPGDSPRHIDWRAVARGRPLQVKQWSSGRGAAVRLEWDSLDLPPDQRAGQMARWIEMCEFEGIPYAMRLPHTELPVGLGEAHMRLSLDALAAAGTDITGARAEAAREKQARVPASHEHSTHLPQGPLLALCAALLMTAVPLLDYAAPVSVLVLALCMAWRLLVKRRSYAWVPVVVLGLGMLAIRLTAGSLLTMESGIAVLMVLLGAKLLESRTPHDFQVMAMVGWFLCLCGLLSEQTLGRSLWTLGMFAAIAACMVRFRRGSPGVKAPLKLTGLMLAQALPVAVVLFFIFPRGSVDFLARFGTNRMSRTGIPLTLEPGRISQVAMSDELAFTAELPAGPPPNESRYWRCVVMWDCEGLVWKPGPLMMEHPAKPRRPLETDTRQVITMEPHGQQWLPCLDVPIQARDDDERVTPNHSNMLVKSEAVTNMHRFTVISRLTQERTELPESHRRAALKLPPLLSQRVLELARQCRERGKTDELTAAAAIDFLRAQGFQYTLTPGPYQSADPLEEFMFQRRVGFCEHFSASFATLMRAAGVPSRVVVGYLGGEWRPSGGWMKVKQSDAHAWTELWLENRGWTRVDPTAALVPARMNLDLETFLLGGEEELERRRNSLWWQVTQEAQQWWDNVEYQWYNTVISFNEDTQMDWMAALGLGRVRWTTLLLASAGFTGLVLGGFALWLRRPARQRDPWARGWDLLCRRLTRLGLPDRHANEGPLAYADRIGALRPSLELEMKKLAGLYAAGRYGNAGTGVREFLRMTCRVGRRT